MTGDLAAELAEVKAALRRHQQWFTDDKGKRLCGGCLEPVPCPDAPLARPARPRPRIDGSVPAASWVAPDGTATLLLPDLVLVLDAIQAACDFCTPELAVRLRSLAIRLGDDRHG